ncbi:MAG: nuclear transport factor 2 family protein [Chitinophagaceae bacterium]|nr:MAG: nuclear transport factor 2 family protein [Chitinophagaceae bacterium]
MKDREAIIENYIQGYNEMDLDKMTRDIDESIQFRNVSKDVVDMELNGKIAFSQQARKALSIFEQRSQTILATRHRDGAVEVDIAFYAVLAQDLPDGLTKGQELQFNGTSVFTFNKDNRIISITDIS